MVCRRSLVKTDSVETARAKCGRATCRSFLVFTRLSNAEHVLDAMSDETVQRLVSRLRNARDISLDQKVSALAAMFGLAHIIRGGRSNADRPDGV